MERRRLLQGAGVAGASLVGVAAVPGVAAASDGDDGYGGRRLLGAWFVTHVDDGTRDYIKSVLTFAAGGAAAVQDVAPAGPTGLGAFKSRDDRFRAHIIIGYPGADENDPGVWVDVHLRGKVGHDEIAARYEFTVYSGKDNKKLDSGTGKVWGERLEV